MKEWYERKLEESGIMKLEIEAKELVTIKLKLPKINENGEKTIVPYRQMSNEFIQEIKENTGVLEVKEGKFVSSLWESLANISASKAFNKIQKEEDLRRKSRQEATRIAETNLSSIMEVAEEHAKSKLLESTTTFNMENLGTRNLNLKEMENVEVKDIQQNNTYKSLIQTPNTGTKGRMTHS